MKSVTLRFVSLFAVLVISNAPAAGQSGFTKGYHTYQSTTLSYYLFVPANLDVLNRYPLVLCLHGLLAEYIDPSTVPTMSMASVWASSTNQSRWPCLILVPICPARGVWPESSELTVIDLLDSLLGEYPIDTNCIYVTGVSMGGGATWELLVRYPNKFAAAVPVSDPGDPSKAALINHIPIWAFYGATDSQASQMRQMIEALERAGATVLHTAGLPDSAIAVRIKGGARLLYTEYPNAGHNIWDRAYNDSLLLPWVFFQRITAGVGENPLISVPKEYSLSQNYPNPFNPSTTIKFELPKSSVVRLSVYDLLGREVSVLVNERRNAGYHEVKFDGSNLASGVYFYRLQAGEFVSSKRMLILK